MYIPIGMSVCVYVCLFVCFFFFFRRRFKGKILINHGLALLMGSSKQPHPQPNVAVCWICTN